MTTKVDKSIEVDVPVSVAYNQWTQFEEFPKFMGGVSEVRQLDDKRLHWVAEIAGVKREWEAEILEQVPDSKVAWAATSGATNAGAVYFTPLGPSRTSVRLSLEYEPEGLVESVGDKLNIVEKRAEADLEKFKEFIESRGLETGGWRGEIRDAGTVGTPGVEDAAASRGDSGKAGISGTAVAGAGAGAAAAAAAAGVAAAAAAKKSSDEEETGAVPYDDTGAVGSAAAAGAVGTPGGVTPMGGITAAGAAAGTDMGYESPVADEPVEIRDTSDLDRGESDEGTYGDRDRPI